MHVRKLNPSNMPKQPQLREEINIFNPQTSDKIRPTFGPQSCYFLEIYGLLLSTFKYTQDDPNLPVCVGLREVEQTQQRALP
jgi:hypothetical protein